MLAVIAEDRTDAETLTALIRNIVRQGNLPIFRKGFSGCGELCRKGTSHLRDFKRRGATHFIICHDADKNDPATIHDNVLREIVKGSECEPYCITIPVEEIEAWIVADPNAVAKVIPTLRIPDIAAPEKLSDPKEWLEDQLNIKRTRPPYDHATHNEQVAKHLDPNTVANKCPSFRPFLAFIQKYV